MNESKVLETTAEETAQEPPMEYQKYEVDEYFVNYHTGDTAARTHARHLSKISNRYAFHIVRLDPDGNERKKIVGTTTIDKALERFLLDHCPEVKKKLQALEIIKREPNILSAVQGYETYDDFQNDEEPWLDYDCVSREEFDLLKEVFK